MLRRLTGNVVSRPQNTSPGTGSPFLGVAGPPATADSVAMFAQEEALMDGSLRKAFLDDGAVLVKGVLNREQLAECR